MSRTVITIPHAMSLQAAAHRMNEMGVSGAPVTDDQGCCVGVLSRTDLVRALDEGMPQPPASAYYSDWQVSPDDPESEVEQFMTPSVIAVSPSASLEEVAWTMCCARVHRVLVKGPDDKVLGVISSLDVLGAIVEQARTKNRLLREEVR